MNTQSDYDVIRDGMRAYQSFTSDTATYRKSPLISEMKWRGKDASALMELEYCVGKLAGESGEALEKLHKFIRNSDGEFVDEKDTMVVVPEELRGQLIAELGDCLWYVAQAAQVLDTVLGDVAIGNLEKLRSRAARGVIKGSGDER